MQAAQKRSEPLEHILLYGNPGLGKTTLSHIIGKEMNATVRVTSGPALERVGDLAAILSNLQAGDILFIDEIHRLNKTIEEVLYPALEDFSLDIILGKGPAARTIRMPLNPFTLIGATTRAGLLSNPLRSRFGMMYHLEFYQPSELIAVLQRSAQILEIALDTEAARAIAERARGTPRIANRLLRRVRDYAQVKSNGVITVEVAGAALAAQGVDSRGLDAMDRKVLTMIVDFYGGGPVGIEALAAAMNEERGTIVDVVEPYLLSAGFLKRTARGRKATRLAYQHVAQAKSEDQAELFTTVKG
jgi:Holliday junction DNA helicase RuvB